MCRLHRSVKGKDKKARLQWFVEQAGSSATVEKVVVLLNVAVRELLGQVVAD